MVNNIYIVYNPCFIRQLTGLWDGSYSYISIDFEKCTTERLLLNANDQCTCMSQ